MAIDELLLLEPQCCDANEYLQLGRLCADGQCLDALRPLGSAAWFSLPFRLGIAPEWLVALHVLLLAISTLLGARAMASLAGEARSPRTTPTLLLFSALVHGIWFWPILRVTLSDLPASALALCGCWLLLLAPDQRRVGWQALAGALCLGAACLVRTFFLYPLYGALLAWLLAALVAGRWRAVLPALLLALLPPLLQYGSTWRHSGDWSFLHPRWSQNWSHRHLSDAATGYDTVSATPYRWYEAPCATRDWLASLHERDVGGAACLALGRLQFYLGSYSARTFLVGEHDNLLVAPGAAGYEQAIGGWQLNGLDVVAEADPAMASQLMASLAAECPAEAGERPLCQASSASTGNLVLQAQGGGQLQQAARLAAATSYTFSAISWSAVPLTLQASLLDGGQTVLANATWPVGPTPTVHQLRGTTGQAGLHRVQIESPPAGATPFVLWGLRLEQGTAPDWREAIRLPPEAIRLWSPWLLAANSAAVLGALAVVWLHRRQWRPAQWAALAFVVLSAGLSIVIVPEQRFFVVPLVASWLLAGSRALIALASHQRPAQR